MKKLVLFLVLLCGTYSQQHACSRIINSVKRAYNCLLPPAYQQGLVDTFTRIASTVGVEQIHLLLPQVISAGISLDELIRHDVPHPVLATILAQTAIALPGIAAQSALRRHAVGRVLTFRDLARGIGMGVCSGILIREGAHLFFIVFPNSWIASVGFIGVSLAFTPAATAWAYEIASTRAKWLWQWCSGIQQVAAHDENGVFTVVIHTEQEQAKW